MENREQQILSEIRLMISSIHSQLEVLEEKLALLSDDSVEVVETEVLEDAPIELDIEDVLDVDVVEEVVPQQIVEEESEQTVEVVPEQIKEEVEMLIDVAAASIRPAVIDTMTTREAWRTDMPGSPVKDIRSAISLNDRILFINSLFDEDPMLFQSVLTKINSMPGLDEVVGYLRAERPAWDMESAEVYRFMMAVRRRIQ